MTDSFLLPVRRRSPTDSIRLAVALTVGACVLGCSDATGVTPTPEPPQPAPVLTSARIELDGNLDTLRVGDSVVFNVIATDQFGNPIGYNSLSPRLSDTRIATIIAVPPSQPWDYDASYGLLGGAPGNVTLTATVSRGHQSRVATKLITVAPAVSP